MKEGTPLPYTTEFYTTHLQGIFCLDHYRVGLFRNEGDRIELDEVLAKRCLAEGLVSRLRMDSKWLTQGIAKAPFVRALEGT